MGEEFKSNLDIIEEISNEHLFAFEHKVILWYLDIVNYLVSEVLNYRLIYHHRKRFYMMWDFFGVSHLCIKNDQTKKMRWCNPNDKWNKILRICQF